MLDSIVFEQHGLPSVSIVTTPFRVTGLAMARSWGLPDFRFLDMPHPISNLNDEEVERRAAAIAPLVAELFLQGQPD